MRIVILILCVIVCIIWQTSIFLRLFPNELLRSFGYVGGSIFFASGILVMEVVTLVAWEQLLGRCRANWLKAGALLSIAPVIKLVWFPYLEYTSSPHDFAVGFFVYLLLVASFSTIRELIEKVPNATSEMNSRQFSAWGENASFSYFRACAWNLGITVISCMAISFRV